MLKPYETVLESDPRHRDQVFHDALTGTYRPLGLRDLRDMVAPITLEPSVPSIIAAQFDIARNAFVYSRCRI